MAAIAYLSLDPSPPDPEGGFALLRFLAELLLGSAEQKDKVGHFIAYAALGGVLTLSLRSLRGAAAAFIIAFSYGALFEFAHSLMGSRSADIFDLLANGLGAAAGVLGGLFYSRFLQGASS